MLILPIFSQSEYGNIINWNEANWEVSNMKDTLRNYSNICQNHEIMFLPNTNGWTTKSAGSICKGLKGSVYVEDTESKKNLVVLLAKSSPFSGKTKLKNFCTFFKTLKPCLNFFSMEN